MRYLTKFNENKISRRIDELNKFCYENLAYLIDEGFEIKIDNTRTDIVITIKSSKLFFWNNVKDDILPFLEVLEEKFYFNNYSKVDFCSLTNLNRRLLLRDVKDDKIVINNELSSIKISEDYITFLRNNF